MQRIPLLAPVVTLVLWTLVVCAVGLAVLGAVGQTDFLKSVADTGLFLAGELQRQMGNIAHVQAMQRM